MTPKEEQRLSRKLCHALRHKPEEYNLDVKPGGWVEVKQLVTNSEFNIAALEQIVANDDKMRYSFRDNNRQIRANQGHSFEIDLQLDIQTPPKYLLHGTAWDNIKGILELGINSGVRNHVHLTDCYATAKSVGARHGKPKVLFIHSGAMYGDGHKFYKSDNGVWLTEFVPTLYISIKPPEEWHDCLPNDIT